MPSPSPVKPRCSSVVALTLTASTGIPKASASFARMAGMWGAASGAGRGWCVDVLDAPAVLGHDLCHTAGQHEAVGPGVLFRRIGEVLADVAQRRCAQHGVHDRMGQHVGVRVAQQTLFIRHFHAAQDELAALHQTVAS